MKLSGDEPLTGGFSELLNLYMIRWLSDLSVGIQVAASC